MKNKRFLLIIISLLLCSTGFAQKIEKVIVSREDPYNLYSNETTDTTTLFYLKMVPAGKPIGVLVIMPSGGELVENAMKQITLHKLAVEKGMIVIFPSLNFGTIKFEAEHRFLDTIFKQIAEQYKVPKDKFVMGGLSGAGMISLSYAEKAIRDGNTFITPKAVFVLDSPVDYATLYYQCKRDVERNFAKPAVEEGLWFMKLCETEFGGSPVERRAEYVKYSIYSNNEKDGGNAKYLTKLPILIYTEPAIEWQLKNRHRDLYDLNCTDLSAMVNFLQMHGNTKVELIVTNDKGFRLDGSRHPHSWSIMDAQQCLNWILKQVGE
ncbi:hypothetical protein ACI6Q2_12210 [Chitinophagaceae bacterium LWZ2-11]